jgi:hypothetical protein
MSRYVGKPRDAYGAKEGTIRAKINAAFGKPGKWLDVDTIVKRTGLPRTAVYNRLHRGRYKGIYGYKKSIRFKLNKKKK